MKKVWLGSHTHLLWSQSRISLVTVDYDYAILGEKINKDIKEQRSPFVNLSYEGKKKLHPPLPSWVPSANFTTMAVSTLCSFHSPYPIFSLHSHINNLLNSLTLSPILSSSSSLLCLFALFWQIHFSFWDQTNNHATIFQVR